MPTSAPGSSERHQRERSSAGCGARGAAPPITARSAARISLARGFTLIELMLVVVLIALATSLASLALRDPAATTLEREAARLAALLESARADARASGLTASWEPRSASPEINGFRFVGFPPTEELPTQWLDSAVTAEVVGARAVILGPEPLIGAQRIVLRLREQRLVLATDGLGPFVVVTGETVNQ
jgi:general secretion pathway protein H